MIELLIFTQVNCILFQCHWPPNNVFFLIIEISLFNWSSQWKNYCNWIKTHNSTSSQLKLNFFTFTTAFLGTWIRGGFYIFLGTTLHSCNENLSQDRPLMYKCITKRQRPSNTWILVHVILQDDRNDQERRDWWWENFHTSWEHISQAWRIKDTQLEFCTNTSLNFFFTGRERSVKNKENSTWKKILPFITQ